MCHCHIISNIIFLTHTHTSSHTHTHTHTLTLSHTHPHPHTHTHPPTHTKIDGESHPHTSSKLTDTYVTCHYRNLYHNSGPHSMVLQTRQGKHQDRQTRYYVPRLCFIHPSLKSSSVSREVKWFC